MKSMRHLLYLAAILSLAGLLNATGGASTPAALAGAPVPATARPPLAQPQLSCSDCINVCLLKKCGFFEPPACVSANLPGCRAQCASSC